MTYVKRTPAKHYCDLPPVTGTHDDWETPPNWDPMVDGPPRLKPGVRLPRDGDVWRCDDCGQHWELTPSPYINVLISSWEPRRRTLREWWRDRKGEDPTGSGDRYIDPFGRNESHI